MSQEKCIVHIVSDSYLAPPFREQLTPWGNCLPWVLVSGRALTVSHGGWPPKGASAIVLDRGCFSSNGPVV